MAIYIAASLSAADVQDACDLATANGDVVELPAGTTGWTGQVSWNAPTNAILRGAGSNATGGDDQTVIGDDFASNQPLLLISCASTGAFRMTGITVQSGSGTLKEGGTVRIHGPGQLRIDHCHFDASAYANSKMLFLFVGLFGVMDHCILDFTDYHSIYMYNGRRGVGDEGGNLEWTLPTEFGSADYFFIEDTIFIGHSGGLNYYCRAFDGYSGSKIVVRFNEFRQCTLGETHATGHDLGDRGTRSQEIYGNLCLKTDGAANPQFCGIDTESGTAVIWGNSWPDVYQTLYLFKITRNWTLGYNQAPTPDGWGYAGPAPIATGVVDVTGTAVTHVSGALFDVTWPAGTMIYINGATSEAVAGQSGPDGPTCSIASVNSTTSITLGNGGHLGAPLTGAVYIAGSAWDGNTDGYGYPVLDQPGRGQGDLLVGDPPNKVNDTTGIISWPNQALEPIYIWGNTGDIVHGWGEYVLKDNTNGRMAVSRDYYVPDGLFGSVQTSPTSPFNGTSGTGFGTLANRPTTCTTGVAYFATDQGSWNESATNPYGVQQNGASGVLYLATSTDTWTLYYEPHVYPHELNIPDPLAPPVNLTPPVITGAAEVGVIAGIAPGTYTGTVPITKTYRWQKRCL